MAAPITPSNMAPMVDLKSGVEGEGKSVVAISKIKSFSSLEAKGE